jgi:hypothetical protein
MSYDKQNHRSFRINKQKSVKNLPKDPGPFGLSVQNIVDKPTSLTTLNKGFKNGNIGRSSSLFWVGSR